MERAWLFSLLWVAVLSAARVAQSLPYDYSSSSECLPEPLDAHYGGGIIQNSNFSAGLDGWSAFGYGAIAEGKSAAGNRFAVAVNRTRPYQSVSQKVYRCAVVKISFDIAGLANTEGIDSNLTL